MPVSNASDRISKFADRAAMRHKDNYVAAGSISAGLDGRR